MVVAAVMVMVIASAMAMLRVMIVANGVVAAVATTADMMEETRATAVAIAVALDINEDGSVCCIDNGDGCGALVTTGAAAR